MQRRAPKLNESGSELWLCPKCNRWLSGNEFYKDIRRWNLMTGWCKRCHNEEVINSRSASQLRKVA
jgi:hypothetical protein